MKSDQSIVEVLATELDLSEQEANSLLAEWAEKINNGLQENGEVQIDDFGTFKKEGGDITFEPAEKFALEVNYKYAGMEPIEVLPAYRKSEASKTEKETKAESGEEKQQETVEASSKDSEEKIEKPKKSESSSSKAEKTPSSSDKQKSETKQQPDNKAKPAAEQKSKASSTESKQEKQQQGTKPEKASQKQKSMSESSKKPHDQKVTKSTNSKIEDKQRSTEWLIVGGLAAVVLLGVAIYFFAFHTTSDIPVSSDPQTEETDPVAAAEEEERRDEEEEIEETPEPEEPTEPEPEPETEQWGLEGEYTPVDDYYTIVVYSLTNRERAESEYDNISNEGYRATLNAYRPDPDSQSWRVGIGQFQSVGEAEDAADRLPDPWRTDHFIIRIR